MFWAHRVNRLGIPPLCDRLWMLRVVTDTGLSVQSVCIRTFFFPVLSILHSADLDETQIHTLLDIVIWVKRLIWLCSPRNPWDTNSREFSLLGYFHYYYFFYSFISLLIIFVLPILFPFLFSSVVESYINRYRCVCSFSNVL